MQATARGTAYHLAFIGLLLIAPLGCRKPEPTRIAFIPQTTGIDIWEAAHESALSEAGKYGLSIYWNAPAREDDAQQQLALLTKELHQPLKGIILAPDQYLALLSGLRSAAEKEVPVAIISQRVPLEPNRNLSLFINDEAATGRILVGQVSKDNKDESEVAIVGMSPNSDSLYRRLAGIRNAISVRQSKIRIVAVKLGTKNIAEDQEVIFSLMRTYPHLDALIALDGSSLRAAWAERRIGNIPHRVRLMGCDRQRDVLRGIRLGEIDSTVAEDSEQMARDAVDFIVRNQSSVHSNGSILEIPPVLITRSNIDTPYIQTFLSLDKAN